MAVAITHPQTHRHSCLGLEHLAKLSPLHQAWRAWRNVDITKIPEHRRQLLARCLGNTSRPGKSCSQGCACHGMCVDVGVCLTSFFQGPASPLSVVPGACHLEVGCETKPKLNKGHFRGGFVALAITHPQTHVRSGWGSNIWPS